MDNAIKSQEVFVYPDGRMDRKNAARYLGLSVKTLAMHASRGTGPKYVKLGRVFYFRHELDTWIKAGEARSTAQATQRAAA
jgi:predicted DNA-binding transcriptional regulator AlpA